MNGGKPVHDENKLFEMLILEGMQAGLSWLTILNKREAFRIAFDNFDCKKVGLHFFLGDGFFARGIDRNLIRVKK